MTLEGERLWKFKAEKSKDNNRKGEKVHFSELVPSIVSHPAITSGSVKCYSLQYKWTSNCRSEPQTPWLI